MAASKLENQFEFLWRCLDGPALEREYRFHPERKWRSDFAHPGSKTILEIDGAVFSGGRHTRGAGFVADCEKHLAAWLLGWSVVRLTARQLTAENIERIIRRISSG